MKYYIARFSREIPRIEGMTLLIWLDSYGIFSVTTEAEADFLATGVPMEEISEDEATIGRQFYAISRDYRSAYSDVEGLTPDEEGGNKTKIYHTDATRAVTLSLMKKIAKRRIIDEFNRREDQSNKDNVLAQIDTCTSIWDLNIKREELLGAQIPIYQAREMGLLDEFDNRIVPIDYNKGF